MALAAPKEPYRPARAMSQPERIHRYLSAEGQPLMEVVVRQNGGKKKVLQRLVQADGGFTYALNGFQAPLYRQDRLRSANPGAFWYLPEGEKDCDRLVEIGFEATTNSMGTGGWRPELALDLAGCIVGILPDMDVPGVTLALKKLADLTEAGVTARIVWLPYPVTEDHGLDVSDWLDQGHDATELRALVRAAFAGEPAPTPEMPGAAVPTPPRFLILSEADLMAQPDPTWQIDKILEAGELSLIYGLSGAGKTFMVTDLMMALLTGRTWCGRAVKGTDVLYVNADGGAGFKKRVRAWRHINPPVGNPGQLWTVDSNVNLFDASDVIEFAQTVEKKAEQVGRMPGLLTIDTLSRCTVGADEISTRDMGVVADACQTLIRRLGTALMVVHHATKDGASSRGVASLTNSACTVLKVEKVMGLISLRCEKQRNWAAFDPLSFRLVPVGDSAVLASSSEKAVQISGRAIDLERVLDAVKAEAGQTVGDLALLLAMQEITVRRCIASLKEASLVTVDPIMGSFEGRPPKGVFPTKKAQGL